MKIGTRSSILAVSQADSVKSALDRLGIPSSLVRFETKGDKILDRALDKIGDKGLFTTELEEALLDREIDLAVHSLKDLPTQSPPGLTVAAYALAEDPRDVFIGHGMPLAALPHGSVVGTASLRRTAWLHQLRPDLEVTPVRGNLHTRLKKWREATWAGIVLAAAGVHRLGWQSLITEYLDPKTWVPAPGQGILAIQMRQDHGGLADVRQALNDGPAEARAIAEREVLAKLGGGCQIPLGAYATVDDGPQGLHLIARVISPDGTRILRAEARQDLARAKELGERVAEDLRRQGADEIIGNG